MEHMTDKKVWLITGAGRGMGTDIARAALNAGHAVVATGRNPDRVAAGGNDRVPGIQGGAGDVDAHAAASAGHEPDSLVSHLSAVP